MTNQEVFQEDIDFDDWDSTNYDEFYFMDTLMSVSKDPMIDYDSFIDRFILNTPDGGTYYFRDYDGAEDFFMLNFLDEDE